MSATANAVVVSSRVQVKSGFDIDEIVNQGKIFLVRLGKGRFGSHVSALLVNSLVSRFKLAIMKRGMMPPAQRKDFFLYVDEFQNFATDLFATVLSEGRKYGIAAIVANQYLTQLDREIRDAIFGNVGSIVSFRLGTQDAVVLSPEMYPVFSPDDLLNLPKYTACVKLLVDGIAGRPFSDQTFQRRCAAIRPQHHRAHAARERIVRCPFVGDTAHEGDGDCEGDGGGGAADRDPDGVHQKRRPATRWNFRA